MTEVAAIDVVPLFALMGVTPAGVVPAFIFGALTAGALATGL